MKKLLALLALLLPFTAEAQSWELGFYGQSIYDRAGQEFKKSGRLYYMQGWYAQTDTRGGWGFVSADTGYFEFTFGEYYTFTDYFEAGLALGTESIRGEKGYQTFGRFAGTARLGTLESDKLFLDFYYEGGPSTKGWARQFNAGWYQANAALSVGNVLFGAFSQTGIGTGPRVRVSAISRHADLRIWGSPAMFEKVEGQWLRRGVLGVDLVLH